MPLTCSVSDHINAPPAAVFAAATDFANAPSRIKGITKMELLTDGPVRVGTRFKETRVMFGKEATETMEVVDLQPGRSYTLLANSCGCEYRTTVSVAADPSGRGSTISFDFSARPLSFGARLMSALMGWMMKGACVKAVRQDLTDLKTSLEAAPTS
jgi:carbon monoxide dehydrogenase subunit G